MAEPRKRWSVSIGGELRRRFQYKHQAFWWARWAVDHGWCRLQVMIHGPNPGSGGVYLGRKFSDLAARKGAR